MKSVSGLSFGSNDWLEHFDEGKRFRFDEEVFFVTAEISEMLFFGGTLSILTPSKLAILRPQKHPCNYRFKPVHWRVRADPQCVRYEPDLNKLQHQFFLQDS